MRRLKYVMFAFFIGFGAGHCVVSAQPGEIRVNVWTVKVIDNSGKTASLPGVKVTIEGRSTTTDQFGRGFLIVPPGSHVVSALGPCRPLWLPSGAQRRVGGTEYQPQITFAAGKTETLAFSFNCLASGDKPETPTADSCFDSDPSMVSLNRSMHLNFAVDQWRQHPQDVAQILIRNLNRKVDLLGECKAITHEHLTFLLAQVSFLPTERSWTHPNPAKPGTGLIREPGGEDEKPPWEPYNLRRHVEWAKAQSRSAVLEEIQKRMTFRMLYNVEWPDEAFANMSVAIADWYHEAIKTRDKAPSGQGSTGNSGAFFVKVAMQQNTATDTTVRVRPRAYPSSPIIVDYSNPNGSGRDYIIIVQPGRAGTGPHGSINKEFAWQIDPARSERKAQTGYAIFPPFDGGFEARYISVDPTGNGQTAASSPASGNGPGTGSDPTAGTANGPYARPRKDRFAIGETIAVDYGNAKASGWDWVVIVEPSKQVHSNGPHSSIDSRYAKQFDANSNSLRDLGDVSWIFPALPAGEYEVRYISWAGGNNTAVASAPFTVGEGSAPPTTGGSAPVTPPTAAPRWNLTGLWRNPGGEGIYRVRQIDAKVVWGLDATSLGSIANMFQGQMSGDNVDGVWEDLPGSPTIGGGRMLLKVESECRFVRVSSVNRYGADVWVRKDSPCDRQAGGSAGSSVTALGPLSGLWRNPGGEAVYRFRHVGSKLHWGVDAVPIRSFANTFQGEVSGTTIEGSWVDLPGSPAISGGKLTLKIESECRIVKTGEAGHYAAQVWVRKDSLCDVTGQQKTAQNPATNSTKPKVEPIPGDDVTPQTARNNPPVVVVSDPAGVFDNKPATTRNPAPKVEPIPNDPVASTPTRPRTPPRVEPIPGDAVASVPTTSRTPPRVEPIPQSTARETPARTTPARTQPTPQPEKTPKPKKEGPGLLDRIAGAINQAVTQQQPQQPPATGGTTQQPDGSCRGGSYWIGAPASPRSTGFQIPWSMPFGSGGHHWRVYRAGTSQQVTNNDQPANANACGLSWHFYLAAGQYDVYLFPGTFANTWNTSTRPVAGPVRVIVN